MRCEGSRLLSVGGESLRVACGSRRCPSCGERWAKDQRVRAVAAAKELPGDAALLTITGPGSAFFGPFPHQPRVRVSERKRWWNGDARERWQALHREASREARRAARREGCDWRLLFRVWEWQKRRVLHLHVVVPYGTPAEVRATDAYVAALHRLSRAHGFGYVLGGDRDDTPTWDHPPPVKRMDVNAVAAYVSKYVSKAGTTKDGMLSVAAEAATRGSVLYVAQSLLRASGVSMTSLRWRRRIVARYQWAKSSMRSWRAACVVDAVQTGLPRLTEEAVEAIRSHAEAYPPTYALNHHTGRLTRPTAAPPPPGIAGYAARSVPGRRVLHLDLASVLLRVPDPENLGWWRTEVRAIGGSVI